MRAEGFVMLRRLRQAGALLLLGSGAALQGGCATDGQAALAYELSALREEVQKLRADTAADHRRIEALEAHLAAQARRAERYPPGEPAAVPGRGPAPSQPGSSVAIPSRLSVVRVEPDPADDDAGSAYIADLGDGSHARAAPRLAVGGPTGGPDSAPPLATEVELQAPSLEPLAGAPTPTPAPPSGAYRDGLSALQRGEAVRAVELLERFVREAPGDPAADNALVALGDALRSTGQPGRALQTYERVVKEFPAGDAVAGALLRYGETCVALGRKAAAKAAFARIVDDHGGSDEAEQARAKLADIE